MKYSIDQMMFAATVRDLAAKRRVNDAPEMMDDDAFNRWLSKTPIGPYVKEVVEEFELIGDLIFEPKKD